jgi:membrane protein involved in colicin uptake
MTTVSTETTNTKEQMKKNMIISLAALALLFTFLLFGACSSNTGQEGVHKMGSAPMSNAKMPGSLPSPDGNQ